MSPNTASSLSTRVVVAKRLRSQISRRSTRAASPRPRGASATGHRAVEHGLEVRRDVGAATCARDARRAARRDRAPRGGALPEQRRGTPAASPRLRRSGSRSTKSAIGSGLRKIAGPPAITSGSRGAALAAARRQAGELEQRGHVQVVGLERDREREQIAVGDRAGRSPACAARRGRRRRSSSSSGRKARSQTTPSAAVEELVDRPGTRGCPSPPRSGSGRRDRRAAARPASWRSGSARRRGARAAGSHRMSSWDNPVVVSGAEPIGRSQGSQGRSLHELGRRPNRRPGSARARARARRRGVVEAGYPRAVPLPCDVRARTRARAGARQAGFTAPARCESTISRGQRTQTVCRRARRGEAAPATIVGR